jgi:hypothetical protein
MADPIQVPGQFTHCVQMSDYEPLEAGAGTIIFQMGIASWLKKFCDYLLGGKLICLGESECAFGRIIGIEPPGVGRSFPDDIDNDFSLNLLLAPHVLTEFGGASTDALANQPLVSGDGFQGRLIADPSAALPDPSVWPDPREQSGTLKSTGNSVTYLFGSGPPTEYIPLDDPADRLVEEVKQDAGGIKRIPVPVLHAECEGSRIFMVCQAITPFVDIATGDGPGPGPSAAEVCHAVLGWIPFIGDLICSLIEDLILLALSPAMMAAATNAWFAAQALDDAFSTGPIAGEIAVGDSIVVSGRWDWDAGHSGWDEFHPVRTIQKIDIPPELDGPGADPVAFKDFRDMVCRLVTEAPPNFGDPGKHPNSVQVGSMTPGQQATFTEQEKPENGWTIHPLVDGCEPAGDGGDDEPPVIK